MTEAEKEFERADMANAEKRAIKLQLWVNQYKHALDSIKIAKENLKTILEMAKKENFTEDVLKAVCVCQSRQSVEKEAILLAGASETSTIIREIKSCKEPTTDSENESVADEGADTCEE